MKIHSVESFGTVDGPGIRYIIFSQGCPLRCIYCHNPDTWSAKGVEGETKELSPESLIEDIIKYKSYIRSGGVTVSGGEPLLQSREVKSLFELCHREGIHTALDTAGVLLNDDVKELLQHTDLVLLDIKSILPEQFETITGGGKLSRTLEFLDYLQREGIATWIRHVVVPGYTDDEELIKALAAKTKEYSVIEKIELLPYHDLSIHKYEALNMKYPLQGVPPLAKSRIKELYSIIEAD